MKTSRLKNIVILILALANVFLAALLLVQQSQQRAAYRRTCEELTALCALDGISIDAAALPRDDALATVDLARDTDTEQQFAELLLGSVQRIDAGGGIYRYEGASGSAVLRSGGQVEVVCTRAVDDPDALCAEVFSAFGYTETQRAADGNEITATRRLGEDGIFNAWLTLRFDGDTLTGADGVLLPAGSGRLDADGLDAVSAVVSYLDYRNASGVICTAITGVQRGYLLQSAASAPLRLVGVWRIETDVASYYVNSSNGEVLRVGA